MVHTVEAPKSTSTASAAPSDIWKMTDDYVQSLGRLAYLWGWPLVNMHNRLPMMEKVPTPGLVGGIIPVAPLGSVGLLHDYVEPQERIVACPNQDVVYGFGLLDSNLGPSVVQVPDFKGRFWVYQGLDQRTDSFIRLGAMYDSKPGFYLLAPTSWAGEVPEEISDVFRFDTRIGMCAPRIFMDDTAEDRAAIQPFIDQVMVYPLAQFTGEMQTTDWAKLPIFPGAAGDTSGQHETEWVVPGKFFEQLPEVLQEVPPRPGEEAIYSWFGSLLDEAAKSTEIADLLSSAAADADTTLVQELFQFRNIGIPLAANWTTQRDGAEFGTDYLSRTAMAKSNIFVNTPNETTYFYQDLDATGARLDGSNSYSMTFPSNGLPPVQGFWSLTLYDKEHFFHPNELGRYSLGTKTKDLQYATDGSLTLYASAEPPSDETLRANWLPAPDGPFSLFIRSYWPDKAILDGTWTPPAVTQQ